MSIDDRAAERRARLARSLAWDASDDDDLAAEAAARAGTDRAHDAPWAPPSGWHEADPLAVAAARLAGPLLDLCVAAHRDVEALTAPASAAVGALARWPGRTPDPCRALELARGVLGDDLGGPWRPRRDAALAALRAALHAAPSETRS